MSKAAMLRLGLPWTPPVRTTASRNSTPSNNTPVKSPIAPVASLNPPSVQPRPTKASALRTGVGPSVSPPSHAAAPQPRPKRTESEIFENTPGHGFRRANLQTNIASIATPKTLPRPNKASALRGAGISTPPSTSSNVHNGLKPSGQSGYRRSVDYQGVPGHKRAEKVQVEATRRPEIEPRMTKASLLRMGGSSNGAKPVVGQPSSRPHGRLLVASKSRQSSQRQSSHGSVDAAYTSDPSDDPDEILALDKHAATLPIDLHHIPRNPAKPPTNDDFGCAIIHHA
ncbi:hypothetical protein VP01_413g5 [Puccinia sorghi]|uniref:Uncharacterized protein n=1 Tax=Puccinia sorghi TaxID=27349 RepID=A0A0L6UR40_9BASI|nr:hypothetical protein VP01_413g5 [Puccinia sorghi]